jgi:hypothetical protein
MHRHGGPRLERQKRNVENVLHLSNINCMNVYFFICLLFPLKIRNMNGTKITDRHQALIVKSRFHYEERFILLLNPKHKFRSIASTKTG